MSSLVPCKRCMKNFEYSPGPNGNARQFCDTCKSTVDDEELRQLEEDTVKEGNRYLIDAPKRKNEYDPLEILVEGNMPEFESDADKAVCALEMAFFLRRQKGGFCGMEKMVAKFLNHLGPPHNVLVVKQWTIQMMEAALKNPDLSPAMKKIANVVGVA